jgi:hypothetical protein
MTLIPVRRYVTEIYGVRNFQHPSDTLEHILCLTSVFIKLIIVQVEKVKVQSNFFSHLSYSNQYQLKKQTIALYVISISIAIKFSRAND